jgi:hypothetical protein
VVQLVVVLEFTGRVCGAKVETSVEKDYETIFSNVDV